jgi:hypothetical protein
VSDREGQDCSCANSDAWSMPCEHLPRCRSQVTSVRDPTKSKRSQVAHINAATVPKLVPELLHLNVIHNPLYHAGLVSCTGSSRCYQVIILAWAAYAMLLLPLCVCSSWRSADAIRWPSFPLSANGCDTVPSDPLTVRNVVDNCLRPSKARCRCWLRVASAAMTHPHTTT